MADSVATLRQRAHALERSGDLSAAIGAYQQALALAPDDASLLADLARLAARMDMPEAAASLWRRLTDLAPDDPEAVDGLARALAAQHLYADAVAVLQAAIPRRPEDARLWNTLGNVLGQQGEAEQALVFYEEAARLDPRFAVAVYNRGGVKFDLGRLDEAAADFDVALRLSRDPATTAMTKFAKALLQLTRGELAQGWEGYETRFSPHHPAHVVFEAPGKRWAPKTPLRGRRVLVVGEQGLGDEVMFSNLIPDLMDEIGADGRLFLAVEPRLAPLFRRSFPGAAISAHETERLAGVPHRRTPGIEHPIDVWTPLASLVRRFRGAQDAFPERAGWLVPDSDRVRHWRNWLGEEPAVGLSWRSGKLAGERRRLYPPQDAWAPLLAGPGVRFINMQYGATPEEIAALGLIDPPGIDLREDLDDLAALCCALNHLVTVPNATGAIAAACGATVSFVAPPHSWPRLGTAAYPWYPQAACYAAEAPGAWAEPIARLAADLAR